jgi:hypothetical protein
VDTRESPRFFELVTKVRSLLRGIESAEEEGALEEELLTAEEGL